MVAMFKAIETIRSNIDEIQIKPGQMIKCTDTYEIFFDTMDNERIQISDIIYLPTEESREVLIAPLTNKLYLVKDTSKLYKYDFINGWELINNTVSLSSESNSYNDLEDGTIVIDSKKCSPRTKASSVLIDDGKTAEEILKTIKYDDNSILTNLYIKTYSNHITPGAGVSTVSYNLAQFNYTNDTLRVYMNGNKLFKDIDYTLQEGSITLISITTTSESKFTFEVDKLIRIL